MSSFVWHSRHTKELIFVVLPAMPPNTVGRCPFVRPPFGQRIPVPPYLAGKAGQLPENPGRPAGYRDKNTRKAEKWQRSRQ